MICARCGAELGEKPYCASCGAARPETIAVGARGRRPAAAASEPAVGDLFAREPASPAPPTTPAPTPRPPAPAPAAPARPRVAAPPPPPDLFGDEPTVIVEPSAAVAPAASPREDDWTWSGEALVPLKGYPGVLWERPRRRKRRQLEPMF